MSDSIQYDAWISMHPQAPADDAVFVMNFPWGCAVRQGSSNDGDRIARHFRDGWNWHASCGWFPVGRKV